MKVQIQISFELKPNRPYSHLISDQRSAKHKEMGAENHQNLLIFVAQKELLKVADGWKGLGWGWQRGVFVGEISYTNKFCTMSYGMENVDGTRDFNYLNFEFNLEFKIQIDFKF